jgi:hypothetical protein
MFAENQLKEWWARRSEDQRAELQVAARKTSLEPPTVQLLLNTSCPVGPIGTKWESQPEFSWIWPEDVRAFVAAQ